MNITTLSSPSFEEVKFYISSCNSLLSTSDGPSTPFSPIFVNFSEDSPLKILGSTLRTRMTDGFTYRDETVTFQEDNSLPLSEVYTVYNVILFPDASPLDATVLADKISQKNLEFFEDKTQEYYTLLSDKTFLKEKSSSTLFNIDIFQKNVPLFYIKEYFKGKLTLIASPIKKLAPEDSQILEVICSLLTPIS